MLIFFWHSGNAIIDINTIRKIFIIIVYTTCDLCFRALKELIK